MVDQVKSNLVPGAMRPADDATIAEAARVLARGGLVAFPTETVYGLGADATSGEAVARIYAAKGRPSFNPLIAHVADVEAARGLAAFSSDALLLAKAFWPGPLTLVVSAAAPCAVADLARAGLESVAIRVPAHPVAQALLRAFGKPVAAPSANRSGRISPTTAKHVADDLADRVDLILDGGATEVGVESTIVSCLDDDDVRILRPGGVSREAIEAALGRGLSIDEAGLSDDQIVAPGMLASHYAPRARVRLDASAADPGEVILDFGAPMPAADNALRRNLSRDGNLIEAAASLFAHLRELDASGAASIAVASIPSTGLGEAINDRLKRAAAPR